MYLFSAWIQIPPPGVQDSALILHLVPRSLPCCISLRLPVSSHMCGAVLLVLLLSQPASCSFQPHLCLLEDRGQYTHNDFIYFYFLSPFCTCNVTHTHTHTTHRHTHTHTFCTSQLVVENVLKKSHLVRHKWWLHESPVIFECWNFLKWMFQELVFNPVLELIGPNNGG